jgi:hypothetical protein
MRLAWLALLAACGGAAARPGTTPVDLEETDWLTGRWRWTHASDEAGVRRVEIEDWTIAAKAGGVTGSYRRQVVFMAGDGLPFRCSQSPIYALATSYQLRGREDGGLWLDEVSYQVEPSPCEGGHRGVTRYRVAPGPAGTLELTWAGGRQRLRRSERPAIAGTAPTRAAGEWRWSNRSESARGEVRVEVERWKLDEKPDGLVEGSYRRQVTVFAEDGRLFPCTRDGFYEYVDRFAVRGWRDGAELQLVEVRATPAASPCQDSSRHLDSAVGRFYGDSIELDWRGRNRQVLSRSRR